MKYSLGDNAIRSGRADAYVWNRNYVIRRMRMPSNPQTAAQTVQRGNFGSLSGNWNSLTDEERATWNALTIVVVDRVGHSVTLTGKDLYVRLNRNLFNAAQAPLTDAPVPTSPLGISSLNIVADVSDNSMKLNFTPTPIPTGTTWLVFATGAQSAGTYKPNPSKFKLITALPAATLTGEDVLPEWSAIFGTMSVGQKIFVKLIAVKNSTGFTSPPTISSTIVVA